MHLTGLAGEPRHYAQLTAIPNPAAAHLLGGTIALNKHITYAAVFLAMAQLPFLINLVHSYFRGALAPPNPWDATTLEWHPGLQPSTTESENLASSGSDASKQTIAVYRTPCEYSAMQDSFQPQWSPGPNS
jgi:cytochrome c oxidase subunit 1